MAKKNEELTLDDLQEQHRQYAEVIGIDNLLRLSDTYGGTSIYISALIMAGATVIGYVIGEGMTDAAAIEAKQAEQEG